MGNSGIKLENLTACALPPGNAITGLHNLNIPLLFQTKG